MPLDNTPPIIPEDWDNHPFNNLHHSDNFNKKNQLMEKSRNQIKNVRYENKTIYRSYL